MIKINDLIQEIKDNNYDDIITCVDEYCTSDTDEISDTIHMICDERCDFSYCALLDWLKNEHNSFEYIEESVREFGIDSHNFDFMRLIQQGQYYGNEQKIYENIEDFLKIWLLSYLRDEIKMDELTEEQVDIIDNLDYKSASRFCDLVNAFVAENNTDEE